MRKDGEAWMRLHDSFGVAFRIEQSKRVISLLERHSMSMMSLYVVSFVKYDAPSIECRSFEPLCWLFAFRSIVFVIVPMFFLLL